MLDNMRQFIVERLLDLDPTLSSAAGSAIYSKVVDPIVNRLGTDPMSVDVEAFILTRLADEFPALDVNSPASVLRDTLVSPLIMLLEPLKNEIEFARKQHSLADTDTLTKAELDTLLDNLFARRKYGSYATTTVRVYFANPRPFGIDPSIVFSTSTGIEFIPTTIRSYLAKDFTQSGNRYYVDVPVRSATADSTSNIPVNAIRSVRGLDGVVQCTNLTAGSGGVTEETNETFMARAERSLSERTLNAKRGIETNILSNFSDVTSVEVVGFGDAAMQRDVIQGTSSLVIPELPGSLLYTTKILGGGSAGPLPSYDPDAGGPLVPLDFDSYEQASIDAAVQSGNFLRFTDTSGQFDARSFSRPRRILSKVLYTSGGGGGGGGGSSATARTVSWTEPVSDSLTALETLRFTNTSGGTEYTAVVVPGDTPADVFAKLALSVNMDSSSPWNATSSSAAGTATFTIEAKSAGTGTNSLSPTLAWDGAGSKTIRYVRVYCMAGSGDGTGVVPGSSVDQYKLVLYAGAEVFGSSPPVREVLTPEVIFTGGDSFLDSVLNPHTYTWSSGLSPWNVSVDSLGGNHVLKFEAKVGGSSTVDPKIVADVLFYNNLTSTWLSATNPPSPYTPPVNWAVEYGYQTASDVEGSDGGSSHTVTGPNNVPGTAGSGGGGGGGGGSTVTAALLNDCVLYADFGSSPPDGFSVSNGSKRHGFNAYPKQGADYSLLATVSGGGGSSTQYVRGAPLPFDNWVEVVGSPQIPQQVLPGRDFLTIVSSEGPARYYPVVGLGAGGSSILLGRLDGYMAARERVNYSGKDLYQYSPDPSTLMLDYSTEVVAFGCPKLSASGPERTDGTSKDDWATAAGVKVLTASGVTAPGPCLVKLEPTTDPWRKRGVAEGHYIAVAYYESTFNGDVETLNPDGGIRWHAWGRITQFTDNYTAVVSGLDWTALTVTDGGQPVIPSGYPCAWTVYRGQVDAVATDGNTYVSYDELMMVPAYKQYESSIHPFVRVDHPGLACFKMVGSSGSSYCGFDGTVRFSRNESWNTASSGPLHAKAVWVRLDHPFNQPLPGETLSPAQTQQSAFIADLESSPGSEMAVVRPFSYQRFGASTTSKTISHSAPSHTVVICPASLPYLEGARLISNPTAVSGTAFSVSTTFVPDGGSNPKGLTGFMWSGQDSGETQVQLFSPIDVGSTTAGIQVSGMPGSVPFPNLGAGLLTLNDNQIHIGGMTDIYVKESASTIPTPAGPTYLALDTLTLMEDGVENYYGVVTAGLDGQIDPANKSSEFVSQALSTYLSTGDVVSGQYKVLYLPDYSGAIKSYRIITKTAAGVRIDGNLSGASASNLRWYVLTGGSTSLTDPRIVYAEGTARVLGGTNVMTVPTAFTFPETPSTTDLYVNVLEGPNRGEYFVKNKFANQLIVDTPFKETEVGMRYKVSRKQATKLDVPYLRITSVSLSGGAGNGVVVPYRHPVDVVASSFSGVNNDPYYAVDGTLGTTNGVLTLTTAEKARSDLGYGDVVRLEDMDEPNRYFYVTGRTEPDSTHTTFLLDRAVVGYPSGNVRFTIGHPSVGTADLLFMDPTMISITPKTVFSFTDSAGSTYRFRPSVSESSVLYRSSQVKSSLVVVNKGTGGTDNFLLATAAGESFLSFGIKAGDEVTVLTRSLLSGQFTSSDPTLSIAGQSLVMRIDGRRYSIVFSGIGTTTLKKAAADFSRQTGGLVSADTISVGSGTYLVLSSRSNVTVLQEGSAGVLQALKLDILFTSGNSPSNTVDKTYTIQHVMYDDASQASYLDLGLTLTPQSNLPTSSSDALPLFAEIRQVGVQSFLPSEMTQTDTGLYSATVRLTSYDPFTTETVPAGQQLSIDPLTYESAGYDLVVENTNYSYSLAEVSSIRFTGVMFPSYAISYADVIPLPMSQVVISYETSPLIGSIQAYTLHPDVRITNDNPLVRTFLPAYPIMSILYRGNVATTTIEQRVSDYLASLYPNLPLEVFDLTTVLSQAGATYVHYPQQAAFLTYDLQRKAKIVRSEDVVTLDKGYHIMNDLGLVTITAE